MMATPLLYDLALVTSLSSKITECVVVCVTFKNKKGSSLTIFYLLAVMIVNKMCNKIRNKKKRKGK